MFSLPNILPIAQIQETSGEWLLKYAIEFLSDSVTPFIKVILISLPEVFILVAMACLLVGMTGSRDGMRYAGTFTLLSMIGGAFAYVL